jgi:hypothetical protein
MPTPRIWSRLSKATQQRYRRQGITPQTYNAYWARSRQERAHYRQQAAAEGAPTGLARFSQVNRRVAARRRARVYARKDALARLDDWPADEDAVFWREYKDVMNDRAA